MSGNDTVVPLESNPRDGVSRQVLLHKLLAHCKTISRSQLQRILQAMFNDADDSLFRMAEQVEAQGNTNPYFDAMRIVRIQRQTIENLFFEALDNNFEAFHSTDDGHDKIPDITKIDYDQLELVSEDDLEIRLASQRLAYKIQSLYTQALYAINRRVACLVGKEEIDDSLIPFGAEALVRAYVNATADVNFLQEVRIILLKLFDQHCVHGLSDLYTQINQAFIDANVLPVIKTVIRKADARAGVPPHTAIHPARDVTAATGHRTQPVDDQLWEVLQAYLSQPRLTPGLITGTWPTSQAGNSMSGVAGLPARHGEARPFTAFTAQELVEPLTALQQDDAGELPQGGPHAVGNFVRVQLQAVTQDDGQSMRQLSPVDSDLIDIVCLIFEYILDDPQLPQTAKASIRRLQIPMLKVALLDKQFFSMRGHPARDLLNQLARAAIGIDAEDEDDPVLAKIDECVQRILLEFGDDMILFSELKREFEDFLRAQQQRASTTLGDIERRQQEREELALARAWVRETLEQHLIGRSLPEVVAEIILGPWKDVMLQTYLQEGEDSLLWKTQIRFIDVLCWSVQPKHVVLDKNKLGNIIRQLITTLRNGLSQIDYPETEVNAIFEALAPYHLASVRGESALGQSSDTLAQAIATTEREYASLQAQIADPERAQDAADDKVILEDIVLEGWESDPMLDAINDEYLDLARHLEMGKWVEFQDEEGDRRHAKLAWKSELLGEYTFLNWKFDVVADKTLLELAEDLRHGKARVVDDVPLMDRALSSVLTTLIPRPK